MPKLKIASCAVRHHSDPCGLHGLVSALAISNTRPAGSNRIVATRRGRPSGSSWVTVTYVVPHATGASIVRAAVDDPVRDDVFIFVILI
jgi:hypothetical protein